jgi:hypothetical protein
MNLFHKGLSAACIFLLMALGCQHTPKQPEMAQGGRVMTVSIYMLTPDPGCEVDYSKANLHAKRKQQVSWQSLDQAYTVVFQPTPPGTINPSPGTPFVDSNNQPVYQFPVPGGGAVKSGVPVVKAKPYFEYSVTDSNGNVCKSAADPGLNIQP